MSIILDPSTLVDTDFGIPESFTTLTALTRLTIDTYYNDIGEEDRAPKVTFDGKAVFTY